ncbi:pentatricopeptide repeat-containing protein At4g16470 [Typha latifolia]|uniref:pentatricopeptide repeat-containing protein At4g16470 n=1 Tax=Typha latifolia TaxID=4733 RepID=UPI003C2B6156
MACTVQWKKGRIPFDGLTTSRVCLGMNTSSLARFGLGPRQKRFHLAKTLRALCISGRLADAVELLWQKGSSPDNQSYALLLQESINRKEVNLGKRIHAHLITSGFTCNDYLKTKLLIFYAKCGELQVACHLFDESPERGLISWNALISGHVLKGLQQKALDLYHLMRSAGLGPDQFTFASVFRACAALAMLEHGKQAHCLMIKTNVKANMIVNTALIDMYFKCSSPHDGHKVFKRSTDRNVNMWTAMISGYGHHGQVVEVLDLFDQMIEDDISPNHVTFLALLSACSHGGLINEGWRYFISMIKDYRIKPKGQHCAAIVDMLGRAGRVNDAYEFVKKLPCKEHSVIWGALIGACRKHGNVELVKFAANKFFKLQPENAGKYVVLANAYAAYEMWGSVADARGMVRSLGMRKDPAWSSIEVRGEVHVFLAGDMYHEQSEMIYEVSNALACALKE